MKKMRLFVLIGLLVLSAGLTFVQRGEDFLAAIWGYSDTEPTAAQCENDVFCDPEYALNPLMKSEVGSTPSEELLGASEAAEIKENCSNGTDDDEDKLVDCADSDCLPGASCGTGKTCQDSVCKEMPAAQTEQAQGEETVQTPEQKTEPVVEEKAPEQKKSEVPAQPKVETAKPAAPVVSETPAPGRRTAEKIETITPSQPEQVQIPSAVVLELEERIGKEIVENLVKTTTTTEGLTEKDQTVTSENLLLSKDEEQKVAEQTVSLVSEMTKEKSQEELQQTAAKYGIVLTTSYVDSDNDGVSDKVEMRAGSNPANADSDGDGKTDAEEFGLGTDPNSATDFEIVVKKPAAVNLSENTVFANPMPPIVVRAPAGAIATVKIFNVETNEIQIRKVQITESNKAIVTPETLSNGTYKVVIETRDVDGNLMEQSVDTLNIDISKAAKAPVIAAPKETRVEETLKLSGKAQPGALLQAYWQSVVMTSVILADSSTGEFEVTSPAGLEPGDHEVMIYGMKDNVATKETKLKFNVVGKALAASPTAVAAANEEQESFFAKYKYVVAGIIVLLGIAVVAVVLKR